MIGASCAEEEVVLLLFWFWTAVGMGTADWVDVIVIVCMMIEPSDCVEYDSLVMIVGGGVEKVKVSGGRVVGGGSSLKVVHEDPNNVVVAVVVTSTVIVIGTCTVSIPPGC